MKRPFSEPACHRPISGRGRDFLRRTAAAVTIAAGALAAALLAGPATAQTADCGPGTAGSVYPVSDCLAMTSTNTIIGGDSLTVSGDGFKALSSVSVLLHSTPVSLGALTSDSSGSVDGAVKIPQSVPVGTHELELAGINPDGTARVLTATVQIASNSTAGSSLSGWFWTGVGILAAVLLVIAALLARNSRSRRAG